MGKMSKEQILSFAIELATKIGEIDNEILEYSQIRFSDYYIDLLTLVEVEEKRCKGTEGWSEELFAKEGMWQEENDDEKLEEIVPRVAEDEDIEAVIFCEGDLYEMLYYYEGYGSGGEDAKKIYDAFVKATEKHDLWYEWGSGIIYLYGASE